jgi:hypothetical protein
MQRLKVKLKPFDATIAKNHSKRRFRPVIHQLFQLRKELLHSRRQKKQQAVGSAAKKCTFALLILFLKELNRILFLKRNRIRATLAEEEARLMQQRDESQDLVHVPQQPVPWQCNQGSVFNDT